VKWLSDSAGFDVALAASGVRVEEVLRYELDKWRLLGWEIPAEALSPAPAASEGDRWK
jgi:hypothetical protein